MYLNLYMVSYVISLLIYHQTFSLSKRCWCIKGIYIWNYTTERIWGDVESRANDIQWQMTWPS